MIVLLAAPTLRELAVLAGLVGRRVLIALIGFLPGIMRYQAEESQDRASLEEA